MIRQLLSRLTAAVLAGLMIYGLAGCSSVTPARYANELPRLDLRQYFNGTLDAWGIFTNRSGEVVKRFTVVIRCDWKTVDGVDVGTLDEEFTYSDGTRQKRVWTLRRTGPQTYVGTASDVVGEAIGVLGGNALNWHYTLALPVDDKIYNVDFDDWMYQMDDRVMLNRAKMSKFGLYLGEVTLSFRRREPA